MHVETRVTPEAQARLLIDSKLEAAGWRVQDAKSPDLGAARGVTLREYPTDTGPADYVLFVDRKPLGVIEAKRALNQAAAQRRNLLKAAFAGQLVPPDPADEPASELLARIRASKAGNATPSASRRGRKAKGTA